jgi:hypothetical protein
MKGKKKEKKRVFLMQLALGSCWGKKKRNEVKKPVKGAYHILSMYVGY